MCLSPLDFKSLCSFCHWPLQILETVYAWVCKTCLVTSAPWWDVTKNMSRCKISSFPSCFSTLTVAIWYSMRKSLGIVLTDYIISSWSRYGYWQQLNKWIKFHHLRNDSADTESKSDLCEVWMNEHKLCLEVFCFVHVVL